MKERLILLLVRQVCDLSVLEHRQHRSGGRVSARTTLTSHSWIKDCPRTCLVHR